MCIRDRPLINQGVEKSNLAASIFQAVVDQSIAGLAQGRNIEGNVLFLGGPLHFLKGLQKRFKETLHLNEDEANFPLSLIHISCILLDMHEYLILILNKAALFCFNSKRLLRFHYDFFRLDRSKGILHSVHP